MPSRHTHRQRNTPVLPSVSHTAPPVVRLKHLHRCKCTYLTVTLCYRSSCLTSTNDPGLFPTMTAAVSAYLFMYAHSGSASHTQSHADTILAVSLHWTGLRNSKLIWYCSFFFIRTFWKNPLFIFFTAGRKKGVLGRGGCSWVCSSTYEAGRKRRRRKEASRKKESEKEREKERAD